MNEAPPISQVMRSQCKFCRAPIEFNADGFYLGMLVECPSCHCNTPLLSENSAVYQMTKPPPPSPTVAERKPSTWLYTIFATIGFIGGGILFLDGASSYLDVAISHDATIFQQITAIVLLGFGAMIIGLSLILQAIGSLIRK